MDAQDYLKCSFFEIFRGEVLLGLGALGDYVLEVGLREFCYDVLDDAGFPILGKEIVCKLQAI